MICLPLLEPRVPALEMACGLLGVAPKDNKCGGARAAARQRMARSRPKQPDSLFSSLEQQEFLFQESHHPNRLLHVLVVYSARLNPSKLLACCSSSSATKALQFAEYALHLGAT